MTNHRKHSGWFSRVGKERGGVILVDIQSQMKIRGQGMRGKLGVGVFVVSNIKKKRIKGRMRLV